MVCKQSESAEKDPPSVAPATPSRSPSQIQQVANDVANTESDRINFLYTYEPCYKQNHLYSFENRTNCEGLKSSTFGKNLKTAPKKLLTATNGNTVAITTTALSPTSSTDIHNEVNNSVANSTKNENITREAVENNRNITAKNDQILYDYYKQYLEKQQRHKYILNLEAPTTNPVEEPKNINNNHLNHNRVSSNDIYSSIRYNSKQKQIEDQPQQLTAQNLQLVSNSNNDTIIKTNATSKGTTIAGIATTSTTKTTTAASTTNSSRNNNNIVNDRLQTTAMASTTASTTTLTAAITSLRVTEKSAINLESFTDIIQRTVGEQPRQQQKRQRQQHSPYAVVAPPPALAAAHTASDDVGDAQAVTQHSVRCASSPASLSGRDTEHPRTTDGNAAPPHRPRFELEI